MLAESDGGTSKERLLVGSHGNPSERKTREGTGEKSCL